MTFRSRSTTRAAHSSWAKPRPRSAHAALRRRQPRRYTSARAGVPAEEGPGFPVRARSKFPSGSARMTLRQRRISASASPTRRERSHCRVLAADPCASDRAGFPPRRTVRARCRRRPSDHGRKCAAAGVVLGPIPFVLVVIAAKVGETTRPVLSPGVIGDHGGTYAAQLTANCLQCLRPELRLHSCPVKQVDRVEYPLRLRHK